MQASLITAIAQICIREEVNTATVEMLIGLLEKAGWQLLDKLSLTFTKQWDTSTSMYFMSDIVDDFNLASWILGIKDYRIIAEFGDSEAKDTAHLI